MQLFTLSFFKGHPVCIQNGWNISDDGTMLIRGPDGSENRFSRLVIPDENQEDFPLLLTDGNVCADSKYGTIHPDKNKLKNKYKALLLIVSDEQISLPEHLCYDNRVRINPVFNQNRTLCASIICFLKTERLSLLFGDEREVDLGYYNQLRFPEVKEVEIVHRSTMDVTGPRKTWLNKFFSFFLKTRRCYSEL